MIACLSSSNSAKRTSQNMTPQSKSSFRKEGGRQKQGHAKDYEGLDRIIKVVDLAATEKLGQECEGIIAGGALV